jgi:hypothetical protein
VCVRIRLLVFECLDLVEELDGEEDVAKCDSLR